jgi:hypothetical protein
VGATSGRQKILSALRTDAQGQIDGQIDKQIVATIAALHPDLIGHALMSLGD